MLETRDIATSIAEHLATYFEDFNTENEAMVAVDIEPTEAGPWEVIIDGGHEYGVFTITVAKDED